MELNTVRIKTLKSAKTLKTIVLITGVADTTRIAVDPRGSQ